MIGWKIYIHRIHGTGICSYVYHQHQPNVGKYAIHGCYWVYFRFIFFLERRASSQHCWFAGCWDTYIAQWGNGQDLSSIPFRWMRVTLLDVYKNNSIYLLNWLSIRRFRWWSKLFVIPPRKITENSHMESEKNAWLEDFLLSFEVSVTLLSVFFGATCHADQAVMMVFFGLASSGLMIQILPPAW